MIRKISFLFIFLLASQFVYAGTHKVLENYADLLNALKHGDNIKAVMTVNKCSPSAKKYQTTDEILWSMDFNNFYKAKFQHQGDLKEGISISVNKLMQSDYGPAYNYVRLRVFANGNVEGYSEFIHPKNFTSLNKATFHCNLGGDAITFYDLS